MEKVNREIRRYNARGREWLKAMRKAYGGLYEKLRKKTPGID